MRGQVQLEVLAKRGDCRAIARGESAAATAAVRIYISVVGSRRSRFVVFDMQ